MLYKEYKIFGPYYRKDGRQHICLVNKETGKRTTVSYPKYLMEMHLGRYLTDEETIDHIDRNFTNNEISNLQILSQSDHTTKDNKRRKNLTITCAWCGKLFTIKGGLLSRRNRHNSGYFCSRSCSGKYGKQVQETGKTFSQKDIPAEYYYID